MRILLDTKALLWTLTNAPRLAPVRELLLDDGNEVFVSTVSWWEIAIKTRLGKLDASLPELRAAARESGFEELPLLGSHAEMLAAIPRYHNDPFDHMLVAQTMAEPMRLITGDSILTRYTPLVLRI
jgi:PIN domain nuclease of toxin-antitoxin system